MERILKAIEDIRKATVRSLVIESSEWRKAETRAKVQMQELFDREQARLKWNVIQSVTERAEKRRAGKAIDPAEQEEIMREIRDFVGTNEDAWQEVMQATAISGYNVGGARALLFLGGGQFNLRNQAIMSFLRNHAAEQVVNISNTTRKRVANDIIQAVDNEEGISGVRLRIRSSYGNMKASRARTIARTELAFASGSAKEEVFNRSGVEKHEWITARDENVHAGCFSNEGAGAVRVGKEFPTGVLREPDHPNCRCTTIPIVDEDFEPSSLWHGR